MSQVNGKTQMQNMKLKSSFLALFSFMFMFFGLTGSVDAATYYVDATNGNDSWTGTVGAYQSGTTGPWKTVGQVNRFSFQPGDNVYFKCGETWHLNQEWTRLTIDWSGTGNSNRSVIGAYYLNSAGSPVIGVNGDKPIFTGNSVFPGDSAPLVAVTSHDNIIFQDLDVRGSSGEGFRITDDADYITIQRCKIHNIKDAAITVLHGCDYLNVVDNEITNWGFRQLGPDGQRGTADDTWAGQCVQVSWNCHYAQIARNTIYKGYSEGIALSRNSNHGVIENNVMYDMMVGIFQWGGCDYLTIRNNLFYYTSDTTFWFRWVDGAGWRPGAGIYLDDEYMWVCDCGTCKGMDHIYVYNNLIHARIPLWIWSSSENGDISDIHIFNNTFVQATNDNSSIINIGFRETRYAWNGSSCSATHLGTCNTITASDIRNNIFYCQSGACKARLVSDGCSYSGLAFDYNYWSSGLSVTAGTVGANDVVSAISPITKETGWTAISSNALFPNDFKLHPTSPAIDKGVALGSPYNLDYLGATRPQGSGWDIGAHEYNSVDTARPASPSGLMVR